MLFILQEPSMHLDVIVEEGTINTFNSQEKEKVCKISPLKVFILSRVIYP